MAKKVAMKLLIDQNISHRIIDSISDIYPESVHLKDIHLLHNSDLELWEFALNNHYVLVTTDLEACNRNVLENNSPKIICISSEVVTTTKVEWVLRVHFETIQQFITGEDFTNCLVIKV